MTPRQWFALLAVSAIWGSSFVFLRVLVTAGVEPFGVAFSRVALGSLSLLPAMVRYRHLLPRDRRTWTALAFLGFLNFALPWSLFAFGQERVPSGIGSVANASMPFWAAIIGTYIVRTETMTPMRAWGLALGFAGVAVLFSDSFRALGGEALLGLPPMLAATFCYGVCSTFIRRSLAATPTIVLTLGQIGFAALYLAPLVLLTDPFAGAELGWHEWLSMLLLGLVGSGVTVLVFMWLIQTAGAVRASVATYLMPPVGVTAGWLLLDEPLSWTLAAGLVLIVGGVALVQGAGAGRVTRLVRPVPRPAID